MRNTENKLKIRKKPRFSKAPDKATIYKLPRGLAREQVYWAPVFSFAAKWNYFGTKAVLLIAWIVSNTLSLSPNKSNLKGLKNKM